MLLLHAGGWDEVAILGAALVVGVGIVLFGGKKKKGQEGVDEPTDEEAALIRRALEDVRHGGAPEAANDVSSGPTGQPAGSAERSQSDSSGRADRP